MKNTRKSLLVWLHGFAYTHERDHVFAGKLADALGAQLYSPDAPHSSTRPRGGMMWYDIPPTNGRKYHNDFLAENTTLTKQIVDLGIRQLKESTEYILGCISAEITARSLGWSNVIIAGHSQGGFMAPYIALTQQKLCAAIAFGGYDILGLIRDNIKYPDTPIIWVNGIGDSILSPELLRSYEPLAARGVRVDYLETECRVNGHDYPSDTIIPKIAKIIADKIK